MKIDDLEDTLSKLEDQDWISQYEKPNFEYGILSLESGREDVQSPHKSDEVYYIIEGDGYLRVVDEDIEIKKGRSIFVPANTVHKFHSNKERILAFYCLN